MRIAVTGANGFAGSAICASLAGHGHQVLGIVRERPLPRTRAVLDCEIIAVADFSDRTRMSEVLRGVEGVVHAAGPAVIAGGANEVSRRRAEGRALVADVLNGAQRSGVQRFILISSIKAVGGHTDGVPFNEVTPPRPIDAYGAAKLAQEHVLREARELVTQVVRPPLLYGPGMKGNMLRLFGAAARRAPLPLARVENRRDILFVGSLGEVVAAVLQQARDHLPVVLARDGQALSSAQLYRQIAQSLGVEARFLPLPAALVDGALRCLGRDGLADGLFKSLEIDDRVSRSVLAWAPAVDTKAALAATAQWYRAQARL